MLSTFVFFTLEVVGPAGTVLTESGRQLTDGSSREDGSSSVVPDLGRRLADAAVASNASSSNLTAEMLLLRADQEQEIAFLFRYFLADYLDAALEGLVQVTVAGTTLGVKIVGRCEVIEPRLTAVMDELVAYVQTRLGLDLRVGQQPTCQVEVTLGAPEPPPAPPPALPPPPPSEASPSTVPVLGTAPPSPSMALPSIPSEASQLLTSDSGGGGGGGVLVVVAASAGALLLLLCCVLLYRRGRGGKYIDDESEPGDWPELVEPPLSPMGAVWPDLVCATGWPDLVGAPAVSSDVWRVPDPSQLPPPGPSSGWTTFRRNMMKRATPREGAPATDSTRPSPRQELDRLIDALITGHWQRAVQMATGGRWRTAGMAVTAAGALGGAPGVSNPQSNPQSRSASDAPAPATDAAGFAPAPAASCQRKTPPSVPPLCLESCAGGRPRQTRSSSGASANEPSASKPPRPSGSMAMGARSLPPPSRENSKTDTATVESDPSRRTFTACALPPPSGAAPMGAAPTAAPAPTPGADASCAAAASAAPQEDPQEELDPELKAMQDAILADAKKRMHRRQTGLSGGVLEAAPIAAPVAAPADASASTSTAAPAATSAADSDPTAAASPAGAAERHSLMEELNIVPIGDLPLMPSVEEGDEEDDVMDGLDQELKASLMGSVGHQNRLTKSPAAVPAGAPSDAPPPLVAPAPITPPQPSLIRLPSVLSPRTPNPPATSSQGSSPDPRALSAPFPADPAAASPPLAVEPTNLAAQLAATNAKVEAMEAKLMAAELAASQAKVEALQAELRRAKSDAAVVTYTPPATWSSPTPGGPSRPASPELGSSPSLLSRLFGQSGFGVTTTQPSSPPVANSPDRPQPQPGQAGGAAAATTGTEAFTSSLSSITSMIGGGNEPKVPTWTPREGETVVARYRGSDKVATVLKRDHKRVRVKFMKEGVFEKEGVTTWVEISEVFQKGGKDNRLQAARQGVPTTLAGAQQGTTGRFFI